MGVGGGGRPGSSGSSTTSSKTTRRPGDPNCGKQVGEAGRPGGWVLVLSLLLRDCVTSDRFPPLSGPHFFHLYDERGWAKEWFQTMLDEALESQRGVLMGCFGGRGSRRQMGQIKVRPHFFFSQNGLLESVPHPGFFISR